ncbi:ninjurin-2 [Drosophila busckii]|uniref:ninjurin-2 n=1 Tax=Drosophila busckii TaxID=30019 RepID=UPI00083EA8EC|nr:ninjurin-2 [Drosophila busckii]
MSSSKEIALELDDPPSTDGSFTSTLTGQCCQAGKENELDEEAKVQTDEAKGQKSPSELSAVNSYATNKNIAEGLMDIALLSANANQLRFLITYNHEASTFYYSLTLVILSLVLQLFVGIALIFKRRLKRCHTRRYVRTNELLVTGVFLITVINVLLAAFTTTDGHKN